MSNQPIPSRAEVLGQLRLLQDQLDAAAVAYYQARTPANRQAWLNTLDAYHATNDTLIRLLLEEE